MFDVVCMGSALVDLVTSDTHELLKRNIQNKGGFFYTSQDEFSSLLQTLQNYNMCAGGSAANSAKIISYLGGKSAFCGKIGKDDFGQFLEKELVRSKVTSLLKYSETELTGCAVIFVHKDSEKTICAKRRASKQIKISDIDFEQLKKAKIIFMEAFWLEDSFDTVVELINFCKDNKIMTALTLGDAKVVSLYRDFLQENMKNIDILLGNEMEFAALGQNLAKVSIKTEGKKGVSAFYDNSWHSYAALPVAKIVSTNGAGDAFAGGFLFGVSQGKSIDESVRIGQESSVKVLQKAGAVL